MRAIFIAAALVTACEPSPANSQTSLYWSDGDSGRINGQDFRLHGVDAPETGGVGAYGGAECESEREQGFEAKEAVVEYTRGRTVTITRDYGKDRYGRLVVDLSADALDIANEMVARGVLKRWDYDGGQAKPSWCG